MSTHSEGLENFIEQFENKHILRCYKAYSHKHEGKIDIHDDQELENAIEILLNANETIGLPPSSDWRQTILDGAAHYEARQVAGQMREAYEEYKLKIEMGMSFILSEENNNDCLGIKNDSEKMILEGRTLNGESPDFNF